MLKYWNKCNKYFKATLLLFESAPTFFVKLAILLNDNYVFAV